MKKFTSEHIDNIRKGVNRYHDRYNRISKICKFCKTIFVKKKSLSRANALRYCSRRCYYLDLKNDSERRYSKYWIKKRCPVCRKKFTKSKYILKYRVAKYCSQKCFFEALKNGLQKTWDRRGKLNPNWKNGISFEEYPASFNEVLREKIRKRDKYKCQNCSVTQIKCFRALDIHHIDYNKRNNSFRNLITLCLKCHFQTNYNREYWIGYFKKKILNGRIREGSREEKSSEMLLK